MNIKYQAFRIVAGRREVIGSAWVRISSSIVGGCPPFPPGCDSAHQAHRDMRPGWAGAALS